MPPEGGVLTLEAGRTYTYTNEQWLTFGNRPVIIEGNGATLVSQARDRRIMPLGVGPILWDGTTGNLGQRIESVAAGERSLQLLEKGDFSIGDAVLVAGYIQQITDDVPPKSWGWPPNFRYFEYHTVEHVDGDAVILSEPLRFSYDASWTEYDGTAFGSPFIFGAPRIWRWRHSDGRGPNLSLVVRNVTFDGNSFGTSMLHLRLENCMIETPNFWPTICQSVELVNCTLAGMEPDKIIESVTMEGGEVLGRLGGGGAGFLSLRFKNVRFREFVQFVGREIVFENCRFDRGLHFATDGALPIDDRPLFDFTGNTSYTFANERKL